MVLLAIWAAVLGFRPDLATVVQRPGFVAQALATGILMGLAAYGAIVASIPGAARQQVLFGFTMGALLVWLGVLVTELVLLAAGGAEDPWRTGTVWKCVRAVLLLGTVPGLLLLVLVWRGLPLRYGWAGSLTCVALGAAGALSLQTVCPDNGPLHLIVSHFLPVAALGIVGVGVGRAILKR
jgi:hypothetical protein